MKEEAKKEVKDVEDTTDQVNGNSKTTEESSDEPEMKGKDVKSSGDSGKDVSEKKDD